MVDHCQEHGHVISKNDVEVLAREEGWCKCKVCEAFESKTRQPTIYHDQGYDLSVIQGELIPFPRGRQTGDYSAMSSGQSA